MTILARFLSRPHPLADLLALGAVGLGAGWLLGGRWSA